MLLKTLAILMCINVLISLLGKYCHLNNHSFTTNTMVKLCEPCKLVQQKHSKLVVNYSNHDFFVKQWLLFCKEDIIDMKHHPKKQVNSSSLSHLVCVYNHPLANNSDSNFKVKCLIICV